MFDPRRPEWVPVGDDPALQLVWGTDGRSVRHVVVAGEVVNVATGVDLAVETIADLVLEMLDKPIHLKLFVDERPGQVDRHIGSIDKAERLLGWRARTSFEDGLERTVDWLRSL